MIAGATEPISESCKMHDDSDAKFYLLVAKELAINKRDEALWTMAFALEDGNESATKAHYIRLRVAQMKNELGRNNKTSPEAIDTSSIAPDNIKIDRHRSQAFDESLSTDMMDEYSAVVGEKNLDYFLSKFAKFDGQRSRQFFDWQWFAFLFPFAWALYRKLYGWAIVFFVLNAAANASAKSFGSAIKRQGGVDDGYGGLYVYLVVMFVPSLLFGVFANSLYWKKCTKVIAQARATNRDQMRALDVMRANGGVNGWVPKLAVAVPIIGIGLAILLPKLQAKKDTSTAPASAQTPQNPFDALDTPAAPTAPQTAAHNELFADADDAFRRQDVLGERKALMRLADQGIAEAQERLGDTYSRPSAFADEKEAFRWYLAAATQGRPSSQIIVGQKFSEGKGTPKDLQQAFKWFGAAAKQGDANGYFYVGLAIERGKGVPKDFYEASKWYRLGAQKNDLACANALASLYENGEGFPQSTIAAYALRKAANIICLRGNTFRMCDLDDVDVENSRNKLTSSDLRLADALALEMSATTNMLGPLDRFLTSH